MNKRRCVYIYIEIKPTAGLFTSYLDGANAIWRHGTNFFETRRQNVKPRIFYQFLAASTDLIQFCYLTMILDTTLGPESHLNLGFKQLWLRKIMSVTYSATENVHFGLIMDVLSHTGLKILLYTFLSKVFNCFLSLFVTVQAAVWFPIHFKKYMPTLHHNMFQIK